MTAIRRMRQLLALVADRRRLRGQLIGLSRQRSI
jgi:hypothetical protein